MLQAGMITMPEQIADVAWMIITKWNWDVFIGLKMV
jgi:hypothetical protein